jgi:signal transduction histidine kinase/CheY-like chemotaxis protein
MQLRQSGIEAIGDITWGAHFCHFYRTQEDLAEILVPYFAAGLQANEACLWVTSDSLPADVAERLMINAIPDFKKYLVSGQIQIVPISDWYTPGNVFDAEKTLAAWIQRAQEARVRGFDGLRLTGDMLWLERSIWKDFMDYEGRVREAFRDFNMISLCTYSTDTCSAEDVIDVCCHPEFAPTRRAGEWSLLESSSLKMAKADLHKLNTELEARVASRTEELGNALAAREQFLAMLGHELRNPLAPIRNATETICALTPIISPLHPTAQILDRQVRHVTRLVDELLDVGRITQGHIQLELEVLPISEIIEQAVELTRPLIDERGHSLSVKLPSRSLVVLADRTRLAQVFGNLLHNAAKYTPNNGEVSIGAEVRGKEMVITVADTGYGIPADKLPVIFDLFTQLPRSLQRSDGGLGIGLTLVKQIAEMHKGTVEAASAGIERGSQFTVRIPLAAGAIEESAPHKKMMVRGAHPPRKILIIDDNRDSNASLSKLLEISGHEVASAFDGLEGIDVVDTFKPDVILLDIGLPGIDGYEVARRIKGSGKRDPRIIALTGYGQSNDLQRAREAGCDAHLIKPAELPELLDLITTVCATPDLKVVRSAAETLQ